MKPRNQKKSESPIVLSSMGKPCTSQDDTGKGWTGHYEVLHWHRGLRVSSNPNLTSQRQKNTSLPSQTLHIQSKIRSQTSQSRKQWDLYRYLMDPYFLASALELVMKNDGAGGIDQVNTEGSCSKRNGAAASCSLRPQHFEIYRKNG